MPRRPNRSIRSRRPARSVRVSRLVARLVCVAAVVAAGARLPLSQPAPASAEVARVAGFAAVVDGWRSWYGSYGMGGLGDAWCIDHGIRAPDPAYAYLPTSVEAPRDVQTAVAWILGAYGRAADQVTAAALMLAVHDLMGAVYPSGPLDVHQLTTERMSGFDGAEAAVLERARQLKAEGMARRHLEAPLTLTASVSPAQPEPGEPGVLHLRLHDATGSGVEGVLLHAAVSGALLTGAVETRTDGDGVLDLPFVAAEGDNSFDVTGLAPDPGLQAFRPTLRRAQRVARPAVVELRAAASFTSVAPAPAPPTRRLTIVKTGDAEPYLPVAGARFEVVGEETRSLEIGESGRVEVDVPAGRYEVREVAVPPGYTKAGPWNVDLIAGDRVLEVHNEARRGGVVVRKTDALTDEAVPGAELVVRYDADADGRHEAAVAELTSAASGGGETVDDLLPGSYRVEETAPPPGYAPSDPVDFTVEPGRTAEVLVTNHPRSTVSFEKVAQPPYDPDAMTLAGATFMVGEAGECTTDGSGVCSLPPDALEGGAEYCWRETVAPAGWAPAEGGCFTAPSEPGGVAVITVAEPSRYAAVRGAKTDAVTGEPVGGAIYDLYRVDDAEVGLAPARAAPKGSVVLAGHTWVGRAEATDDGWLRWPVQIAGYRYCAREHAPPEGYLPDAGLTCSAETLTRAGATLELVDHPITTAVAEPPEVAPVVVERPVPRAVPETTVARAPMSPAAPQLAATGFGTLRLTVLGAALLTAGLLLVLVNVRK